MRRGCFISMRAPTITTKTMTEPAALPWWKTGVVYQIYPRSFQDSNGDGIGDLQGVIDRLDYLQALGVNILWLTPYFNSPQRDNGYDISDYCGVDPRYGDLVTLDRLIAACHTRGMKFVMDAVISHTSDQHPWFVESRASRDNPKRDWYFWRPGKNGREPNNWAAGFAPSAWEFDARTGEYYLHYYATSMPDLNWDNTALRQAMFDMLRWWLDRGVDGFRIDSANLIKKDPRFPDAANPDPGSPGYFYDPEQIYNLPGLTALLQELNRKVLAGRDVMTVGETSNTSAEAALDFVHPDQQALDMVFNFEPVEMPGWDLVKFKDIQRRWYGLIQQGGWSTQYLSNHDQPRQVSRFGDDGPWRVASAKALATLLHTLPGTPFIYQGEELGMSNCAFARIEDYDDVAMHNAYRSLMARGRGADQALHELQASSRDNARTPMQWSAGANAGFTAGKPWLAVNPNHARINAEAARADASSVFHHYRSLIALRRQHAVLVRGDFTDLLPSHPALYAYTRCWGDVTWLVLINLSGEPLTTELPLFARGLLLLSSGGAFSVGPRDDTHAVHLQPWQAVVLQQ
jgi:oligo-1,6-glucosidase